MAPVIHHASDTKTRPIALQPGGLALNAVPVEFHGNTLEMFCGGDCREVHEGDGRVGARGDLASVFA
jgi:hypothetical protein